MAGGFPLTLKWEPGTQGHGCSFCFLLPNAVPFISPSLTHTPGSVQIPLTLRILHWLQLFGVCLHHQCEAGLPLLCTQLSSGWHCVLSCMLVVCHRIALEYCQAESSLVTINPGQILERAPISLRASRDTSDNSFQGRGLSCFSFLRLVWLHTHLIDASPPILSGS